MKNFLHGLVTGVAILVASCSPSVNQTSTGGQASTERDSRTQNPEKLRVLCYNIHYANPPSKEKTFIDLDAIAKVINEANPDVVALQEVDVNTGRSGKINEAKELAARTGMKAYYFGKAIDHDGGDYGVAILSKYDMFDTRTYPLPDDRSTNPEPRVLATARIKTPSGFEFIFASTHLEVRREENRLMQMEEIGKIVNASSLPVVIAGDFNARPESETIKRLDALFARTCNPCEPTIPVINPNRTIDYIAYRPKDKFQVVEHKVIQETYASDHLPVFAVLQIQPK
ncbi:endonuclease/exonuclease/phosphatase family protein [Rufibacter roseus]|uniref:Endonuclease/exonuclease/phosphatase family protein n=1 Tax=Rufibacter roseus TaxID=1567108 RepID=A0ABW2DJP2_9BACT|nr:endonuclease/exonuclease/phosphatase family protein [Rufibacter roseus]